MDDKDLTPEEREALRRIVHKDQARRDRETQERATILTAQLRAQYGRLDRSGT